MEIFEANKLIVSEPIFLDFRKYCKSYWQENM